MDPFLTYSTNRALREVVWKNYYSRGDNGDEFDNNVSTPTQTPKTSVPKTGGTSATTA